MQICGNPGARILDAATCFGPDDAINKGAVTVLLQHLPSARQTDSTFHGGIIIAGAPTVEIGGPTFAIPSNFRIQGSDDFKGKTVLDLYYLSTLPSGKVLLDRLAASGETITITEYIGTDNSYCSATNPISARVGIPTGSTVEYSPGISIQVYDSSGNLIDMPPQIVLGHELDHALGNAEGTQAYGTDPMPPPSEPRIPEEEARAIGVGSHSSDAPSENSLRRDAGLPERGNHLGIPIVGSVPNLRPGES